MLEITFCALAYDSFGRPLAATGPTADAHPFRFTGREWDAATGLYYSRAAITT
ncbi:MAG: hypothetical protein HY696_06045 [Deltaproteobacteria bacterium]|nr:hypothetical protein [Deltaproteobacteria bacterium]